MFRDNLVLPLAMAIWSLPGERLLEYPARAILQFFENHRLLAGYSGDAWRTFVGGSVQYVRAFQRSFDGQLLLGQRVTTIRRNEGQSVVVCGGRALAFDKVVVATHADTALSLLERPTAEERLLLGAWRYHPNTVTLHTDPAVLHRNPRLWSSWNVVRSKGRAVVSYDVSRVQRVASSRRYFLTLGEDPPIEARHVVQRFEYRHPVFDRASVATQVSLAGLNGSGDAYFCGSYAGHGFHEDAVASALAVTRCFGLGLPVPAGAGARAGVNPDARSSRPAERSREPTEARARRGGLSGQSWGGRRAG
jgi:uncharacterized protein